MSLLFSNFPPLKTKFQSFETKFHEYIKQADEVYIACGYISADAVVDLQNLIKNNKGPYLHLCIGMHAFDGLTHSQNEALIGLKNYLDDTNLGKISVVTTFPFHGKVVSFVHGGDVRASIIGSSNLSNTVSGQRQYEADYVIDNSTDALELKIFIEQLIEQASQTFGEFDIRIIEESNQLLIDQIGVEKVSAGTTEEIEQRLGKISFDIPLKTTDAPKSNLNAYFGEGRKNQQGFIIPRSWYEVELIVGKEITLNADYPSTEMNNGIFEVITDDGWSFQCKVGGDFNKNLRSEGDLKILGKWIKGRLEKKGILKPGELVTEEMLQAYGRSSITMTKFGEHQWYLDFGVNDGRATS